MTQVQSNNFSSELFINTNKQVSYHLLGIENQPYEFLTSEKYKKTNLEIIRIYDTKKQSFTKWGTIYRWSSNALLTMHLRTKKIFVYDNGWICIYSENRSKCESRHHVISGKYKPAKNIFIQNNKIFVIFGINKIWVSDIDQIDVAIFNSVGFYSDGIALFSFDYTQQSQKLIVVKCYNPSKIQLWQLNCDKYTWMKLREFDYASNDIECNLSASKRYLIMASGCDLCIYDIQKSQKKKCRIKTPNKNVCFLTTTGGIHSKQGWILCGYVRSHYQVNIPQFLIQMLTIFYCPERVQIHSKKSVESINFIDLLRSTM